MAIFRQQATENHDNKAGVADWRSLMRDRGSFPIAFLLLCSIVLAQPPAAEIQTFHVKGTVTDFMGAVIPGTTVTFKNEQLNKTTATNDLGVYEVDLPLGAYTMTAQKRGFRHYLRPPFRVTSPTNFSLDVMLPIALNIDRIEVRSFEAPLTPAGECVGKDPSYYGDESFPAPASDGFPLQLYIRYAGRTPTGGNCIYTGEKGQYEDPVFVAYNLFSLQAERVVYNVRLRTIEASGNVVALDETGTKQHAETLTLKIENGKALSIR